MCSIENTHFYFSSLNYFIEISPDFTGRGYKREGTYHGDRAVSFIANPVTSYKVFPPTQLPPDLTRAAATPASQSFVNTFLLLFFNPVVYALVVPGSASPH